MASTIHFVSLGCVKNRVDSEVMLGVARSEGYQVVESPELADVIVVNTCGFIGEAKKESIATIFELADYKRQGSCHKLVVTGCLSQRYSSELAAEMAEVDHFLGSSDMLRLAEVLRGTADRMLVGNPADWIMRATDPRVLTASKASVYVKLAEGCNRSCSFCVIPQLRGPQRSRPADDILQEAKRLVDMGAVELNLIAQDTVSYGRDLAREDRVPLAQLTQRLADLPGVRWVRLFYLYPEALDDALLELFACHPKVVPYVDMPLQHASEAMLQRMRRGHGRDRQRRVVERLREAVPGLTFRTAFIVGHPGETDQDFDELCAFVEWARFEHVGVFRYSDEETTASYDLTDKVKPRVAASRYGRLMGQQRRIAREKNRARIGQELEVLVEGPSEEHEFVLKGRHAGQAPEIDGQVYLSGGEASAGTFVRVLVSQASDYDLVGEILDVGQPPARPKRVVLPVLGNEGRHWK
ncbi:MAG: 30S ribosomal protein S12 methylthiotransferase RimO [Myxococcales bacterium]